MVFTLVPDFSCFEFNLLGSSNFKTCNLFLALTTVYVFSLRPYLTISLFYLTISHCVSLHGMEARQVPRHSLFVHIGWSFLFKIRSKFRCKSMLGARIRKLNCIQEDNLGEIKSTLIDNLFQILVLNEVKNKVRRVLVSCHCLKCKKNIKFDTFTYFSCLDEGFLEHFPALSPIPNKMNAKILARNEILK